MKKLFLILILCLSLCACGKADDYENAVTLMDAGNYDEAITAFTELGDYEDSAQKLAECKNILAYNEATALFEAEKYEEALSIFISLDNYNDSKEKVIECENALAYNKAVTLITEGSFTEAKVIFETIPTYKDVSEYLARYVTIEITPENWETYFTAVPQPNWKENAFGEGELWGGIDYCLSMREEYADKLITANVAMGFTSKENCYVIEIDAVNFTYNITDYFLHSMHTDESTITFTENSNIHELIIDHCEVYPNDREGYWYVYNSDEIILVRSKGSIEIFQ